MIEQRKNLKLKGCDFMNSLTLVLCNYFVTVGKIVISYDIIRFVFRNIRNFVIHGDTDLE